MDLLWKHYSNTLPAFMELEASTLCSQNLAVMPFLQTVEFSPCRHTLFSKIHFNIILPSMPCFPSNHFPLDFQIKMLYARLIPTHAICPPNFIILDLITLNNIRWRVEVIKFFTVQSSPSSCYFLFVQYKYCSQHPGLKTPSIYDGCSTSNIQECVTLIQSEWKVTQPTFKYLLMVAIQYNLIGLINTQYRCDYTTALAGHTVTCSCQSISCLSTVEMQGCLFHRCNKSSLSNTTWHLVLI
jgi:hypothetical protein